MAVSYYVIPIFVLAVFLYALVVKCNAYDVFIEGSKDGIKTSITILPYLMSMFICVKVFSASGFLNDLIRIKSVPIEILMQAIFRPVSNNASMSFMLEVYEIYGVDSKEGIISSVMQGGTDTTIYVMTLYFGSIGVTKYRYSFTIGLLTDFLCFVLCMILYFYIL